MGNKEENKKIDKEQLITLTNRKNISVSGTNKIISLKPDLIQLDTVMGPLLITGEKLELLTLDNISTKAEITGDIVSIKFLDNKVKEPLFRKLFKWFLNQ